MTNTTDTQPYTQTSAEPYAQPSEAWTFWTTFLFGLPYSELVTELSKVPSDAIVILLTVFADAEGKTFN